MRTDIVDVSALSNVPATDGFQSKSASRAVSAEQRISGACSGSFGRHAGHSGHGRQLLALKLIPGGLQLPAQLADPRGGYPEITGCLPGRVAPGQSFVEARFSCREPKRFVQLLSTGPRPLNRLGKAAHQLNVFCDAVLSSLIALDARHLQLGRIA
jgi:hypothetical protein